MSEVLTGNMSTFPSNLKQIRMERGYSMDALCDLYNKTFDGKLNKSTLSRYENGLQEPMFSTVVNLCKILNVALEEMLTQWSSQQFMDATDMNAILKIVESLNREGRDRLIDYANYLATKPEYIW